MYEYIKGILVEVAIGRAVVDVGGLGYEVFIPMSTFDVLPSLNETVTIYTHFHVREDIHKLYGFYTNVEREVFRKLIGISKIGPKVGLNVLSGLSVKDIVHSVQMQDSSRLKTVSGIGPKTAQRLVMELKGKLQISGVDLSGVSAKKTGKSQPLTFTSRDDAYSAMVSLGYNEAQVLSAITRVEETIESDAPVEQWIKKALQVI